MTPEDMMDEYVAWIRPRDGFVNRWRLTITGELAMANGVAWNGDLFRDDVKVGTAENQGNGGGSWPRLEPDMARVWHADLVDAYPDGGTSDERFVGWLEYVHDGGT